AVGAIASAWAVSLTFGVIIGMASFGRAIATAARAWDVLDNFTVTGVRYCSTGAFSRGFGVRPASRSETVAGAGASELPSRRSRPVGGPEPDRSVAGVWGLEHAATQTAVAAAVTMRARKRTGSSSFLGSALNLRRDQLK